MTSDTLWGLADGEADDAKRHELERAAAIAEARVIKREILVELEAGAMSEEQAAEELQYNYRELLDKLRTLRSEYGGYYRY